jgi:L-cysteine S-thiosulfotransferase
MAIRRNPGVNKCPPVPPVFHVCLSLLWLFVSLLHVPGVAAEPVTLPADYCQWKVEDYGIRQPLCGLTGDSVRGKAIVSDSQLGNCLACHQLPIEGIEAYGTLAPPLVGIGARLNAAQIRLRVVDSRNVNPQSIMPGFYRDPRLINRPAARYRGKTFLSAQQVEDVIAYLVTLR